MDPREEAFKEELGRLIAEWKVEDERMRERMQASTTLNDAARAEARRWRQERLDGGMVARETPPHGDDSLATRLDRFEHMLSAVAHDVGQLKQDVGQLKQDVKGMVTKVEFEGLRHEIAIMADGYQETQRRLDIVAELLTRSRTA